MADTASIQFLVDPPLPGGRNMEIDQSLLLATEQAEVRLTFVRFYAWETATLSIGHHQEADRAADLHYCASRAIPVVRRPTGGRAVLHDDELTYAVISNDTSLFPLHRLDLTYLTIARFLQAGLDRVGIRSELARGLRETGRSLQNPVRLPCFASASRHELLVDGRKIAGSAQRRLKRSFLQHGSVPLGIDPVHMAAALGVPESLVRKTTISVSEAAGRHIGFAELAEALLAAFSSQAISDQAVSDQKV
jgi:lipoyl(octanoyl) transferase